jgi:hypothetical protein
MRFHLARFFRCLASNHWMGDDHRQPGKVVCSKCGYSRKP